MITSLGASLLGFGKHVSTGRADAWRPRVIETIQTKPVRIMDIIIIAVTEGPIQGFETGKDKMLSVWASCPVDKVQRFD